MHGPEMRHGHKSALRCLDGRQAEGVVGTATQLITVVNLLLGNAWDSTGASCLVEQSRASVETLVVEAWGFVSSKLGVSGSIRL